LPEEKDEIKSNLLEEPRPASTEEEKETILLNNSIMKLHYMRFLHLCGEIRTQDMLLLVLETTT
jgi:hypothetical protein